MFNSSFKLRHLLAVTTALSFAGPMLPAQAQDAPNGTGGGADNAAPPARVGEISDLSGSVSFNGAGSNGQWTAASLNYPVSTNDSLFTQGGAQATLAVDSSRLTLAENTELQVTGLDQNSLSATESQGEMFLAVSYLQPGQNFVITTPRGTMTISQNGNYDIAVGDQNTPTVISVLSGAATVSDPGATLQVAAGQTGVLSGTDQTVAQLGSVQQDAFITSMLSQNSVATAAAPPAYCPPVVRQMTGVTALASYGSWSQNSSYGAVWYPSVGADWTPYRQGHWSYVAPWGYTWVDSEPWGFAPFHYGRWIDDGNRWGWAPAPAYSDYSGGGYGDGGGYQPVYAPAVVSFFGGIGAGIGIGLTIGALNSGAVGWVPLGPNEAYYPSYGYGGSRNYINRINYVNVRRTDITNINNSVHNTTIINNYNNYKNRRGATYINAAEMSRGEAVGRYGKPVPQDMLAKARPIGFRPGQAGGNAGQPHEGLPPPNFAHRAAAQAPHPTAFGERHKLPPAVISHEPAPALRPGQQYAGPGRQPGAPGFGQNGPGGQKPGQHPGQPAADAVRPGQPGQPGQPGHPGQPGQAGQPQPHFGGNPGFHPPPPPPGAAGGQHLGGNGEAVHPGQPNPAHPGTFNGGNQNHPGGFNQQNTPHETTANPGFHPPPAPPGGGQHVNNPGATTHPNLPNVVHPGEPLHPVTSNEAHPAPNVYNGGVNHPQGQPAYHPQPQQYHPQPQSQPQQQQYHPQPQQQFHPQPQNNPQPQQQFHPQPQQQFHPQPQQQFHPQPQPQPQYHPQPQQQFHPQPLQQFHPQPQPQPQPRPEPRPQQQPHDQHQDNKGK